MPKVARGCPESFYELWRVTQDAAAFLLVYGFLIIGICLSIVAELMCLGAWKGGHRASSSAILLIVHFKCLRLLLSLVLFIVIYFVFSTLLGYFCLF